MEDAHILMPDFAPGIALFGVLDGHGGKGVSNVAAQVLPTIIRKHPSFNSNPPDYSKALSESFLEMDEHFRTQAGTQQVKDMNTINTSDDFEFIEKAPDGESVSPCDNMGTTCVVALVFPCKVIVANLGDSRCILAARTSSMNEDERGEEEICVPLSSDHKPGVSEEGIRIVNAGGLVMRDMLGGFRINGGLNVSRCFGDFSYKKNKGPPEEQMISPVPDIREYPFGHLNDICIILACDGIFERNTNEDVVNFALTRMNLNGEFSPRSMAERLCDIAVSLCDSSMCTFEERFSFEPKLRFSGQDNMTTTFVYINSSSANDIASETSPMYRGKVDVGDVANEISPTPTSPSSPSYIEF